MSTYFNTAWMQLRLESKERENRSKPPVSSPDVVQTAEFAFSPAGQHGGDSGDLLLATRKRNKNDRYLVKHAFTDCACNEFVYTKLALAMDYSMPDAVLFQLSPNETRSCFATEYIIGARLLNVRNAAPSYEEARAQAKNWEQYFAFHGLYALTGESDGVELLLADDQKIYRVDTTDAFPISSWQLDMAGMNFDLNGVNLYEEIKKQLLSADHGQALNRSNCDMYLALCLEQHPDCRDRFLEPFERIQGIPSDYIDDFLNTLCYFYPDYIGEYFKRYISALQKQAGEYRKGKRL